MKVSSERNLRFLGIILTRKKLHLRCRRKNPEQDLGAKKSRDHFGLGMSLGMLFAAAPGKAAAVSSYGYEA